MLPSQGAIVSGVLRDSQGSDSGAECDAPTSNGSSANILASVSYLTPQDPSRSNCGLLLDSKRVLSAEDGELRLKRVSFERLVSSSPSFPEETCRRVDWNKRSISGNRKGSQTKKEGTLCLKPFPYIQRSIKAQNLRRQTSRAGRWSVAVLTTKSQ